MFIQFYFYHALLTGIGQYFLIYEKEFLNYLFIQISLSLSLSLSLIKHVFDNALFKKSPKSDYRILIKFSVFKGIKD